MGTPDHIALAMFLGFLCVMFVVFFVFLALMSPSD
jgi:hypothetical protein